MPDDELFATAKAGRLRTIGGMAEQVRRLLSSPKSQALVENFAGQWLQLRTLERLSPDRCRAAHTGRRARSRRR